MYQVGGIMGQRPIGKVKRVIENGASIIVDVETYAKTNPCKNCKKRELLCSSFVCVKVLKAIMGEK